MDLKKLFGVLVVGSATLATAATGPSSPLTSSSKTSVQTSAPSDSAAPKPDGGTSGGPKSW